MHPDMTVDKIRIMSIQDLDDKFVSLLINNMVVSFIIVMIGLLGLKIVPAFYLSFNAFYLGELLATANKPDTIMFLYSIVPHGIIEIPTGILAATFGCYLAYRLQVFTGQRNIFGYLRSKININPIVFSYGIKPYVMVILPLIIIGCVIEAYVSLYIMRIIFNGS